MTRRFGMYLILPDANDGLPALVDKISSDPQREVKVRNFLIPKFKITFGFEASKVLNGLGLTLPFTIEMVDSPLSKKLFVSEVFHKSFIEVNEEGIEAAVVTAAKARVMCCKIEKPKDFVADHPFLFLIRDNATGVVLFIGSVLNPHAG